MRAVLVDTDADSLYFLEHAVKEVFTQADVVRFSDAVSANDYLLKNNTDYLFCEIAMQGVSGLTLANTARGVNNAAKVVFVTKTEQYAVDALMYHADGYLLKPISAQKIGDLHLM